MQKLVGTVTHFQGLDHQLLLKFFKWSFKGINLTLTSVLFALRTLPKKQHTKLLLRALKAFAVVE
jgi:hypothetical protein